MERIILTRHSSGFFPLGIAYMLSATCPPQLVHRCFFLSHPRLSRCTQISPSRTYGIEHIDGLPTSRKMVLPKAKCLRVGNLQAVRLSPQFQPLTSALAELCQHFTTDKYRYFLSSCHALLAAMLLQPWRTQRTVSFRLAPTAPCPSQRP